jgi:hypothetical protein
VLLLRTYVKKFIPSQKYCIFNDDWWGIICNIKKKGKR